MKLAMCGVLRGTSRALAFGGEEVSHSARKLLGRKAQLIWTLGWAVGDHLAIVVLDILGIWAHRHLELALAVLIHLILIVGIARLQRRFEILLHQWLQTVR